MIITSEKEVIKKAKEGFKLKICPQFKSYFYYITNYKDSEYTVARSVIKKMKAKGLIDSDDCFRLPST